MARKRKHTKKHTRRRRHRMSGVPKGALMSSVGVIAGAVVGRLVAKKVLPNLDEKIKNAGVIAIGALLMPKVIKSELGRSLGTGMVAAGGLGLAGSFLPAIAGHGDYIDFPVQVGEVDDNISVIAGDDVMAGDDSGVMAGDDSLALIAGDDMDEYDY